MPAIDSVMGKYTGIPRCATRSTNAEPAGPRAPVTRSGRSARIASNDASTYPAHLRQAERLGRPVAVARTADHQRTCTDREQRLGRARRQRHYARNGCEHRLLGTRAGRGGQQRDRPERQAAREPLKRLVRSHLGAGTPAARCDQRRSRDPEHPCVLVTACRGCRRASSRRAALRLDRTRPLEARAVVTCGPRSGTAADRNIPTCSTRPCRRPTRTASKRQFSGAAQVSPKPPCW